MATLNELLLQLDAIKQQINACECDISTCMCVKKEMSKHGIQQTFFSLTTEVIENVLNNNPCVCERCANLTSYRAQFEVLKVQVYNKINEDYRLTAETNPFII